MQKNDLKKYVSLTVPQNSHTVGIFVIPILAEQFESNLEMANNWANPQFCRNIDTCINAAELEFSIERDQV